MDGRGLASDSHSDAGPSTWPTSMVTSPSQSANAGAHASREAVDQPSRDATKHMLQPSDKPAQANDLTHIFPPASIDPRPITTFESFQFQGSTSQAEDARVGVSSDVRVPVLLQRMRNTMTDSNPVVSDSVLSVTEQTLGTDQALPPSRMISASTPPSESLLHRFLRLNSRDSTDWPAPPNLDRDVLANDPRIPTTLSDSPLTLDTPSFSSISILRPSAFNLSPHGPNTGVASTVSSPPTIEGFLFTSQHPRRKHDPLEDLYHDAEIAQAAWGEVAKQKDETGLSKASALLTGTHATSSLAKVSTHPESLPVRYSSRVGEAQETENEFSSPIKNHDTGGATTSTSPQSPTPTPTVVKNEHSDGAPLPLKTVPPVSVKTEDGVSSVAITPEYSKDSKKLFPLNVAPPSRLLFHQTTPTGSGAINASSDSHKSETWTHYLDNVQLTPTPSRWLIPSPSPMRMPVYQLQSDSLSGLSADPPLDSIETGSSLPYLGSLLNSGPGRSRSLRKRPRDFVDNDAITGGSGDTEGNYTAESPRPTRKLKRIDPNDAETNAPSSLRQTHLLSTPSQSTVSRPLLVQSSSPLPRMPSFMRQEGVSTSKQSKPIESLQPKDSPVNVTFDSPTPSTQVVSAADPFASALSTGTASVLAFRSPQLQNMGNTQPIIRQHMNIPLLHADELSVPAIFPAQKRPVDTLSNDREEPVSKRRRQAAGSTAPILPDPEGMMVDYSIQELPGATFGSQPQPKLSEGTQPQSEDSNNYSIPTRVATSYSTAVRPRPNGANLDVGTLRHSPPDQSAGNHAKALQRQRWPSENERNNEHLNLNQVLHTVKNSTSAQRLADSDVRDDNQHSVPLPSHPSKLEHPSVSQNNPPISSGTPAPQKGQSLPSLPSASLQTFVGSSTAPVESSSHELGSREYDRSRPRPAPTLSINSPDNTAVTREAHPPSPAAGRQDTRPQPPYPPRSRNSEQESSWLQKPSSELPASRLVANLHLPISVSPRAYSPEVQSTPRHASYPARSKADHWSPGNEARGHDHDHQRRHSSHFPPRINDNFVNQMSFANHNVRERSRSPGRYVDSNRSPPSVSDRRHLRRPAYRPRSHSRSPGPRPGSISGPRTENIDFRKGRGRSQTPPSRQRSFSPRPIRSTWDTYKRPSTPTRPSPTSLRRPASTLELSNRPADHWGTEQGPLSVDSRPSAGSSRTPLRSASPGQLHPETSFREAPSQPYAQNPLTVNQPERGRTRHLPRGADTYRPNQSSSPPRSKSPTPIQRTRSPPTQRITALQDSRDNSTPQSRQAPGGTMRGQSPDPRTTLHAAQEYPMSRSPPTATRPLSPGGGHRGRQLLRSPVEPEGRGSPATHGRNLRVGSRSRSRERTPHPPGSTVTSPGGTPYVILPRSPSAKSFPGSTHTSRSQTPLGQPRHSAGQHAVLNKAVEDPRLNDATRYDSLAARLDFGQDQKGSSTVPVMSGVSVGGDTPLSERLSGRPLRNGSRVKIDRELSRRRSSTPMSHAAEQPTNRASIPQSINTTANPSLDSPESQSLISRLQHANPVASDSSQGTKKSTFPPTTRPTIPQQRSTSLIERVQPSPTPRPIDTEASTFQHVNPLAHLFNISPSDRGNGEFRPDVSSPNLSRSSGDLLDRMGSVHSFPHGTPSRGRPPYRGRGPSRGRGGGRGRGQANDHYPSSYDRRPH